ncbi:MAG: hypothetical protein KA297_25505 [Kofleriaceae bacterium]|nr:hypothetical protein [Kofleriaceae bacterium]
MDAWDKSLLALRDDSPLDEVWATTQEFVRVWFPAGSPAARPRLGLRARVASWRRRRSMPRALRQVHDLVEANANIYKFNRFMPTSDDDEGEGEKLTFLSECQGMWDWATSPTGDDPKVWCSNDENDGEPWREEPLRLSRFLLQSVLFEAVWDAPAGADTTPLRAEAHQALVALVAPVVSATPSVTGQRFYVREGALVMTQEHDGACDVRIAARTAAGLEPFRSVVDDTWDNGF